MLQNLTPEILKGLAIPDLHQAFSLKLIQKVILTARGYTTATVQTHSDERRFADRVPGPDAGKFPVLPDDIIWNGRAILSGSRPDLWFYNSVQEFQYLQR